MTQSRPGTRFVAKLPAGAVYRFLSDEVLLVAAPDREPYLLDVSTGQERPVPLHVDGSCFKGMQHANAVREHAENEKLGRPADADLDVVQGSADVPAAKS